MDMGLSIVRCADLQVAVWLHTEQDPPAVGWAEALGRVAELKKKMGGEVASMRMLVITDGGAPNTTQRSELFAQLLEGKTKTAVVTTVLSNRLKRGIATAIFWLNPGFRAFGPDQFSQALTHLDLDGHGPALLSALTQLQRSVSTTKILPMLSLS
jgi:hypothetical protein